MRVTCKSCKRGVIEVPRDRFQAPLDSSGQCYLCGYRHLSTGASDPFNMLKIALENLAQLKELEIEFDVPVPENTP